MAVKWILGIDVGQKKTGIAVGQTVTGLGRPLGLLRMPIKQLQAVHFTSFVREWSIDCFVIGMPTMADGKVHPLTSNILRLGEALKTTYDLEVYYVDETLTSHEAKQRFGKRGEYDSAAAAVMIETFIADNTRI